MQPYLLTVTINDKKNTILAILMYLGIALTKVKFKVYFVYDVRVKKSMQSNIAVGSAVILECS